MAQAGSTGGSTPGKVVRWSTVGSTMYGYDAYGRLVQTKPAPVTALPAVPKATVPTALGGGSTYTPRTITPPKVLGGGSTYTAPKVPPTILGGGSTQPARTNTVSTPTGSSYNPIQPLTPSSVSGYATPDQLTGASAPMSSTAFNPNAPGFNPGGLLGQVPNWASMMGTYQDNPQAWMEKVMQLQGMDPLGRNYAMAQAAAPYFSGLQFLAPFLSSIGTGNTDLSNGNAQAASAAAMLNWVGQNAGRPGQTPYGMPSSGGIFGNLASGIGNNQSMLYDLLIGQQGLDEQASVLNDLVSAMGMTGSLAGPWAAALQSRLGRLGSEYLMEMGNATTQNPLGPLVEYFLRTVGFPNARAATSNLIP